jgi:hypothetical protein
MHSCISFENWLRGHPRLPQCCYQTVTPIYANPVSATVIDVQTVEETGCAQGM